MTEKQAERMLRLLLSIRGSLQVLTLVVGLTGLALSIGVGNL